MDYRVRLGATDLSVSAVCFGTWQLSPRFWGPQPKDQLLAAMRAAFEAGVNFFDTAEAYGDGLAETVLGEFAASVPRDQVVIATKVFNHFNPDGSRYPDLSPAHIVQRCEISLERLRTDCIDVYLLHMFDPLTPLADIAETLDRLKKQGKIRHYGVSNFSVEQLRIARRFGAFNVSQPPYSLLRTEIEADHLPYCLSEDVGVMAYSPLHMGLLTGKYTGAETFRDFRQHHADFQSERFRWVAQAVLGLQPMAERYGLTRCQLILAATLSHPAIQVAVVGTKTPEQITEAAGAMGKTIEREDYFAIRAALAPPAQKVKDATGAVK
jgi:aryl-alcohol dehydrogenase-like predicted oxidoreductase